MTNIVFYDINKLQVVHDIEQLVVPRAGDQLILDNTLYSAKTVTWDLDSDRVLVNVE